MNYTPSMSDVFWARVLDLWNHNNIDLSAFRFSYERMRGFPITSADLARRAYRNRSTVHVCRLVGSSRP